MKKRFILILIVPLLIACGSSKKIADNNSSSAEIKHGKIESNKHVVNNVIKTAKEFEGTRYKFGGTTKAGMDCSGLVYRAFRQVDIALPRVSRDMARKGVSVRLRDIMQGDLIFFKTGKRRVINHVGLVVESNRMGIRFIHSTTSQGVIISSLNEDYWKKAFVEARRVI